MNSNNSESSTYRGFKNITHFSFKKDMRIKHKTDEKQLALISGSLAQIYKDGIRITEALDLVADILSSKIYKDSLYGVLELIKQGSSLSQGFSEFKDLYPEFFIGIISIGENTGKLYEVLKGLSVYYDKLLFIKKEIKNACIYPMFVFISMILLSIFLVNEVIPNFFEIYKSMNIKLPKGCQVIYDMSIAFKDNHLVTGVAIFSWGLILIILIKCLSNQISINKLTKISIVRSFFEYIMVLLFSIITSTGINISQALKYCENSMSFMYLRNKITEINSSIISGETLTESLEKSGVFSKYALAIVRIREEGGTIEEGFKELANTLEYRLNEKIQKYLKMINPIFIIMMASFITLFLMIFVLPLFNNLQGGIRK
ncbi:type II secretion system F family protein [Clostridium beijerinckii]|uniref:Type II secretion system F family protein n=1 Tax=Clostridium beijerinckii TaxID=1520 RepID=A0A7X9SLC3_CLOBE|nr:type II secretion system F family protein [Clostridium beijerinckii]NMF04028.1 type II secretion system F family protein [Clostridium beijerinckii]